MLRRAVALVVVCASVGACSSADSTVTSGPSAPIVADGSPATACDPEAGAPQRDDEVPAVGTIAVAVSALQAELGVAVDFFEINATARLVNLFVALNGATVVQPWLYADGRLTAQDGRPASGGTFSAADLDFDPSTVLATVRREVPAAVLETFYVHGDGDGHVQYGLLASARCAGGLDIVVSGDGAVLSVDPIG